MGIAVKAFNAAFTADKKGALAPGSGPGLEASIFTRLFIRSHMVKSAKLPPAWRSLTSSARLGGQA
jgi:hypothetical protein